MRDIRFRGKRLDNGEWAQGYLNAYTDGTHEIIMNSSRKQTAMFGGNPFYTIHSERPEVDPATVGQYTGLECDNGSVYEGDIVWWSDMQPFSYVFFCDGAFRVTSPDSDTAELLIDVLMGMKIVDNIHDNPELLEVGL